VIFFFGGTFLTYIVTAYLIKKGASFQKAGNIITDARRIAKPNQAMGFFSTQDFLNSSHSVVSFFLAISYHFCDSSV